MDINNVKLTPVQWWVLHKLARAENGELKYEELLSNKDIDATIIQHIVELGYIEPTGKTYPFQLTPDVVVNDDYYRLSDSGAE